MSTYFPDDDTADGPAPSSDVHPVVGPSVAKCDEPEIPLPPFSRMDTTEIIEQRLKQSTQLVARVLVGRTKKNGTVKISMPTLATITGYTRETIGDLIAEIVEAGLLNRRLTRDGYVYTWTRLAYKVGQVGDAYGIWRSPTGELQAEQHAPFRQKVQGNYLLVWRDHYKVPKDSHVERNAIFISDARLIEMHPYTLDLASRIERTEQPSSAAIDIALQKFFKKWVKRAGKQNCLADSKHPLSRLSSRDIFEDFTAVFAELAQEQARQKEIARNASTRQLESAPKDAATPNAAVAAGSKDLLAALNKPSANPRRAA